MPALLLVSLGIWYLSLRLYIPLAQANVRMSKQSAEGGRVQKLERTSLFPYERQLRLLRALIAAAPLLGLLGTVKGMIATFITLGRHGTTSMELLSVGISAALITTQVGLVVALPGLVGAHAVSCKLAQLKNTCKRITLQATTKPPYGTAGHTREALP